MAAATAYDNIINNDNNVRATSCCDSEHLCRAAFWKNSQHSSTSPAAQYQKLKQIQNTVRVESSLYAMNLAAMNARQTPKEETQIIWNSGTPYVGGGGVNWNQMSDRKVPHIQNVRTANPGASSTRHTITRLRPGAGSPGGIGVDIKHNCYERYLNRIKSKGPLLRGVVPDDYDINTKDLATSLVSGCDCSDKNAELLYENTCGTISTDETAHIADNINHKVPINEYNVGDFVWTSRCKRNPSKERAQILSITADKEQYTVIFNDCCTMRKPYAHLMPYQKCAEHLYPISYYENGRAIACRYLEFSDYQKTWAK